MARICTRRGRGTHELLNGAADLRERVLSARLYLRPLGRDTFDAGWDIEAKASDDVLQNSEMDVSTQ